MKERNILKICKCCGKEFFAPNKVKNKFCSSRCQIKFKNPFKKNPIKK